MKALWLSCIGNTDILSFLWPLYFQFLLLLLIGKLPYASLAAQHAQFWQVISACRWRQKPMFVLPLPQGQASVLLCESLSPVVRSWECQLQD